jgi:hypothetical protein
MPTKAIVHVISKADIGEHKTVSVPTTLPALEDGHVRVRSAIISLTNNNLSYAQLGTALKWWDAYPVPSGLETPYNDRDVYGIVPAWGYAEVLESRIDGLEPGNLLWGFWPTSDLPVDLRLEPAGQSAAQVIEGQWMETSEARCGLMNMYQRYFLPKADLRLADLKQPEIEIMAWETAVRTVYEAGYLLNHAVFGKAHIHPSGEGAWTEEDADLESTVIMSLAASGKTARAFAQAVVCQRDVDHRPWFLAVSSTRNECLAPKSETVSTKVVTYKDIREELPVEWLEASNAKKFVIVDFGGRGDALPRLHEMLSKRFPNVQIVVIGVGGSPEVRTAADLGHWAQRNGGNPNFNRIRMNTSPIRDALSRSEGDVQYFQSLQKAWENFRQSSIVSDLKLELGQGIAGSDGFEGGWSRIIEGKVGSDVALTYRV